MKKLILILSVSFLFLTCNKKSVCDEPNLDCSSIRCIAHFDYFEFRLMDKTTGKDLVFSNDPKYDISEIKLFADVNRTIPLTLTADINKSSLISSDAKTLMYLEIKGTDVYRMDATFGKKDCCSDQVKTLRMNDQSVCTCCDPVISLKIQ